MEAANKDLKSLRRISRIGLENLATPPLGIFFANLSVLVDTDRSRNTAKHFPTKTLVTACYLAIVSPHACSKTLALASWLLANLMLKLGSTVVSLWNGFGYPSLLRHSEMLVGLWSIKLASPHLAHLPLIQLTAPTDDELAKEASELIEEESREDGQEEGQEAEETAEEDEEAPEIPISYRSGIYHLHLAYNGIEWMDVHDTAVLNLTYDEETGVLSGKGISSIDRGSVISLESRSADDGDPERFLISFYDAGKEVKLDLCTSLEGPMSVSGEFVLDGVEAQFSPFDGWFTLCKDARGYSERLFAELTTAVTTTRVKVTERPFSLKSESAENRAFLQLSSLASEALKLYLGSVAFTDLLDHLRSMSVQGVSDADVAHASLRHPRVLGETNRKYNTRMGTIVAYHRLVIVPHRFKLLETLLTKAMFNEWISTLGNARDPDHHTLFFYLKDILCIQPMETLKTALDMQRFLSEALLRISNIHTPGPISALTSPSTAQPPKSQCSIM